MVAMPKRSHRSRRRARGRRSIAAGVYRRAKARERREIAALERRPTADAPGLETAVSRRISAVTAPDQHAGVRVVVAGPAVNTRARNRDAVASTGPSADAEKRRTELRPRPDGDSLAAAPDLLFEGGTAARAGAIRHALSSRVEPAGPTQDTSTAAAQPTGSSAADTGTTGSSATGSPDGGASSPAGSERPLATRAAAGVAAATRAAPGAIGVMFAGVPMITTSCDHQHGGNGANEEQQPRGGDHAWPSKQGVCQVLRQPIPPGTPFSCAVKTQCRMTARSGARVSSVP